MKLAPISKAIAGATAGGVCATVVALGTAMADGDLTGKESVVAIGAGLVLAGGAVGGIVYRSPANRPS
ncbi:hypothetical protein [Aeromicrobium sp. 9AM]|uniref:hypothetical protein n=1 Tax=Aeromicrobium sp. 9AM TaxID=2653126 RepID=UPI0012F17157|nr:hypothetical protein [Aeromicrobium sp. 9AM]VXC21600.1 conserved exported hypothetical protein [Aeromicrobium sp. 9AM]